VSRFGESVDDELLEAAAGEGKAVRGEGKALVRARKHDAIDGALEVSAARYVELRDQQELSPDESAELARAQCRIATGKVNEEQLAEADIDAWQDGRLEQQVRMLEDACNPAEISQRDRSEDEAQVPMAARHYDGPRKLAVQALFEEVGLNPANGEGSVTSASVADAYQRLRDSEHAAVLQHFGLASFNATQQTYPVRWLGQALKRCGLWLDASGERAARTYTLAAEPKYNRRGELQLPGLGLMSEYRQRRAEAVPFADESIVLKSNGHICEAEPADWRELPSVDDSDEDALLAA
jgi:hypothetical protein